MRRRQKRYVACRTHSKHSISIEDTLFKDALSLEEVEAMREAGDVLKLSERRNCVASMTDTF